jgi:Protein of unknown function with HXXEE motif
MAAERNTLRFRRPAPRVEISMLRLRKLVALAPLIFIAHVLEEAPGFVAWMNAHVEPDISAQSFWQVNLTAFVITLVVCTVAWFDSSRVSDAVVVAWFAFLMAANSVLHIGGGIVDRGYCPGMITAAVLYVPYCIVVFRRVRQRGMGVLTMLVISIVSAIPMLVHGYRILFLGSRLF